MRTKNSVLNVSFTMIGQAIKLLLNFVVRFVFIKTLSVDYLGLDGLFTNILLVLSLTELGVGQAITYSLYEPLKEKNTEKIKSIMNLFKKSYIFIGCFILFVGLSLNPILKFLINNNSNIPENINIIYSLSVISVALSYFASYKRELLNADQKLYMSNICIYSCLIVMNILQIAFLILTRQYYIFLLIKIAMIIIENIMISIVVDKQFPFLKDKHVNKLDKNTSTKIKKNILGAVFYKVGKVGINASDNIIISKILGLAVVGFYSNYRLIISSITNILNQLFSSLTASIGNLGVEKDDKKNYSVFKNFYFIGFCIYSIISIFLVFVLNNFIEIWLGKDYMFNNAIVYIIVINFFK